jgi:hypothetical protein
MTYPSVVAGIGGKDSFRVVITQPWLLHNHVGEGEWFSIVPNLYVNEPLEWNEMQHILEVAKKHVAELE